VAYGHREIHVHPGGHRRISIFEAMLLQGFPEDFVLEGTLSSQVEQVSNAVPPPLAQALATAIKDAMRQAKHESRGDEPLSA
jgi:DNA (cytosine-5)-methyltransferase 1